MKRAGMLLACVWCCFSAAAQEPGQRLPAQEPGQSFPAQEILAAPPALPEYVYCEICGPKGAGRSGIRVTVDFGQPMQRNSRFITDREGRKITFNSCIDALNYMACRGWELVQAYAAGEDNDTACMLLRMPTSKLTEAQRQALLASAMKTGE